MGYHDISKLLKLAVEVFGQRKENPATARSMAAKLNAVLQDPLPSATDGER